MYSLDDEVEKRMQNDSWNKEISERVISERGRRTKKKLTLAGSLFVGLFIFVFFGLSIYQSSEEIPWNNYLMSAVVDSTDIDLVPADVDDFITYAFK